MPFKTMNKQRNNKEEEISKQYINQQQTLNKYKFISYKPFLFSLFCLLKEGGYYMFSEVRHQSGMLT